MQILRLLVLVLALSAVAPPATAAADRPISIDADIICSRITPTAPPPAAVAPPVAPQLSPKPSPALGLPMLAALLMTIAMPLLGYISLSLKSQVRRRGMAGAPLDQQHCDLVRMQQAPPERTEKPADERATISGSNERPFT